MKDRLKIATGFACIVIFFSYILVCISNPDFSSFEKKISNYYLTEGWKSLKAANVVTSIVWDFRGFDTLGEETVLFTAAIGVFALGFGGFVGRRR